MLRCQGSEGDQSTLPLASTLLTALAAPPATPVSTGTVLTFGISSVSPCCLAEESEPEPEGFSASTDELLLIVQWPSFLLALSLWFFLSNSKPHPVALELELGRPAF